MQMDFVTELFTQAAARGIHTCLDTSGITFRPEKPELLARFDRLMAVTRLVMLDIKHIDSVKHEALCSQKNDHILAFAPLFRPERNPDLDPPRGRSRLHRR